MGYVGLPLALAFADGGFRVLGFDVDQDKVEQLNAGESYVGHIPAAACQQAIDRGRLEATADFTRLGEPDALLICVPTPIDAARQPDLTHVRSTALQIRDALRPGQLVVLESTTYPGTTDGFLLGILAESGLVCGHDYFLAFSPEREDPGSKTHSTRTIPKLVGGVDERSLTLAAALYRRVVSEVVEVSSSRVAEAAKLTENIFRAVNIALVNELKVVFDEMGVDIWEVLDAAETKPFGFVRFNPGPGWGGHCIPIDPYYLAWRARQVGVTPRFIELAGEVNREMPRRVVERLRDALDRSGKTLSGSRILVLGLAYKKDIADPRESPAFAVLDQLLQRGASVCYHDPHIGETPKMRSWPNLPTLRSVPLEPARLASLDAVLIITDHSDVAYDLVLKHASLIVDTRGVYRQSEAKVVRA